MRRVVIPLAILVALAFVPKLAIDLPYVFKGPLNTPGTLQLLALCLVFGGLALSYDRSTFTELISDGFSEPNAGLKIGWRLILRTQWASTIAQT